MIRLLGVMCLSAAILGCAAPQSPACSLTDALEVGPTSATADHAASVPGNQAQFQAVLAPHASAPSCPVPQYLVLVDATWTLSDSLDAQISSAATSTNGLATCNNAASNPITVTAAYTVSGATQTATATLVCK
jgi:hypothetical protein